jgi:hypothetical protein
MWKTEPAFLSGLQSIAPEDGCRAFRLRFNVRLYDEVSGGADLEFVVFLLEILIRTEDTFQIRSLTVLQEPVF